MKNISFIIGALFLIATLHTGCENDDPIDSNALFILAQGDLLLNHEGSVLFTANKDVDWFVADTNGGTINAAGIYEAPIVSGAYRIVAVNKQDPTETASAEVLVSEFADDLRSLRNGGFVIHFRHAIADSGADNTMQPGQWWKSCDPDSARQLSAAGKLQALQIGTVIKRLRIPIGNLTTSEYCRCVSTGEIMDFGVGGATSDLITFAVYDEPSRHANTLLVLANQPAIEGENALVVSHSWGIGFAPLPQLSQGDAAIFRPNPGGQEPVFVNRIPAFEWTALYREP